jgi:hypothetical protein
VGSSPRFIVRRSHSWTLVEVVFHFLLRKDLPSQMMKRPFMLSRSRMAEAVTESKIFPYWEGMRLVVTIAVPLWQSMPPVLLLT